MDELEQILNTIRTEQQGQGGTEYDCQVSFSSIASRIHFDGDSPESENLDFVIDHGFLDLLARELRLEVTRLDITETALTATTTVCLSERNAAKVAASGIIIDLATFLKKHAPQPIAAYALTSLTNLALHNVSHKQLKAAGILPMAVDFLRFISSEVTHELDFGLTSASLICRLVGYEESGPGPESIRSNGKLVEKMTWLLKAVLDAGPNGTVIGYTWNPANIMYDISVLATSDRNKPLLYARFFLLIRRSHIKLRQTNAIKNKNE
jgi:hypothetical protein